MRVLDICKDHGLDVRSSRTTDDFVAYKCPFCGDLTSFFLDPNTETFECVKCGLKGGARELDDRLRRARIVVRD